MPGALALKVSAGELAQLVVHQAVEGVAGLDVALACRGEQPGHLVLRRCGHRCFPFSRPPPIMVERAAAVIAGFAKNT